MLINIRDVRNSVEPSKTRLMKSGGIVSDNYPKSDVIRPEVIRPRHDVNNDIFRTKRRILNRPVAPFTNMD